MEISTQNAVLIEGCTLADIERTIERAVDERMAAFVENLKERPPVMMKRKEAARMLGVSLPTLGNMAKAGILHAQHIGGRVYFLEDELEKYSMKKTYEREKRIDN